jgi:hypothetical protein
MGNCLSRFRRGHNGLDDANAAAGQCLGCKESIFQGRHTHCGYDSDFLDPASHLAFVHRYHSFNQV